MPMYTRTAADSLTWGSLSDVDGHPPKETTGPILIQSFMQYLCQGVIISQGVKFYHRWEDDPVALRVYVVLLLFFSLLQTVLESYKTWVEVIDGLHWWTSKLHWTEFFFNALICALCEAFLIRRCYRITQRSWVVLSLLSGLLVTTTIASIILTIRISDVVGPFLDNGNADPLHASTFAYPLWVYGTLVMALSLTTIHLNIRRPPLVSVSLWRTRTGLRHLDRTLNHIIFITFESAALPTACMLFSAAIFSVREYGPEGAPVSDTAAANAQLMSKRSLHLDLFFAILTGKVYTLGILRTLNSRTQFRAGLHTSNLGRRSLTGWDGDAHGEQQAAGGQECSCAPQQDGRVRRGSGVDMASRDRHGTQDPYERSSEDTLRVGPEMGQVDFGAALGDRCVRVQSMPTAHYTAPKIRKTASKGSCGAAEGYPKPWHSPP
ncbi:hypothetical protein PYCCODRAFT_1466107 [Trametes coccinea BRFM310]|uniref:Uncharacterized protein n=1 Tax=Trametes coccinea (strain BRFM310) TaxID=1353009 RepID=A0A1Y2IWR0_TRAC3|nr:hypothetical protein PYCCODRAFT_1466107 [Trametes coccinea BRFM310]